MMVCIWQTSSLFQLLHLPILGVGCPSGFRILIRPRQCTAVAKKCKVPTKNLRFHCKFSIHKLWFPRSLKCSKTSSSHFYIDVLNIQSIYLTSQVKLSCSELAMALCILCYCLTSLKATRDIQRSMVHGSFYDKILHLACVSLSKCERMSKRVSDKPHETLARKVERFYMTKKD